MSEFPDDDCISSSIESKSINIIEEIVGITSKLDVIDKLAANLTNGDFTATQKVLEVFIINSNYLKNITGIIINKHGEDLVITLAENKLTGQVFETPQSFIINQGTFYKTLNSRIVKLTEEEVINFNEILISVKEKLIDSLNGLPPDILSRIIN